MEGDQRDPSSVVVLAELRRGHGDITEFISIREPDPEELEAIRSAADLVRKVARLQAYRRLQALTQLVLERIDLVESRAGPTSHEIAGLLEGLTALVEARRLAVREVADIGGGDPEEAATPEWAPLLAAALDETKLMRDREGVVGVLDDTGRKLVRLSFAVQRAVFEVQVGVLSAVSTRAEDVAAAGRRLRLLQTEAVEGTPILLGGLQIDEGGELRGMQPEGLSIEDISEALRIARTSKDLRQAEQLFPVETEVLDTDEQLGSDATADASTRDPHLGPQDTSPPEAGSDPNVRADEKHAPEDHHTPVDIAGLLRLAGTLNDELARAWSDALERAQTESGIQQQLVAVGGALRAVGQLLGAETLPIAEFPPSPSRRAQFEGSEDLATEATTTAQLLTFKLLARAIEPLTRPTTVRVEIDAGHTESIRRYWESGAFARVARNLDLMRDVLESESSSAPVEAVTFRRLQRAQAAWFNADPESCLLHAVSGLGAHFGVKLDALEAAVAASPELLERDLAAGCAAGVRLAQRIVDGESLVLLAVLLAPLVSDALADLAIAYRGDRGMTGDQLFDLIKDEIPFERLVEDEPS